MLYTLLVSLSSDILYYGRMSVAVRNHSVHRSKGLSSLEKKCEKRLFCSVTPLSGVAEQAIKSIFQSTSLRREWLNFGSCLVELDWVQAVDKFCLHFRGDDVAD